MARPVSQIFDEIIEAKEAEESLDSLSSNSSTAIWRMWAYITAVAIWTHEKFFDEFKEEIENISARAIPGTLPWWRDQLLRYQDGDDLSILENNQPGYEVVDEEKQIISRAAAIETEGTIVLKANKSDSGDLVPLSAQELERVEAYVNKVRIAGPQIAIISLNADLLKLIGDVYFDAVYPESEIKDNVTESVNEYLANLDFNGAVVRNKLKDAIRSVEGIIDVNLTETSGRPSGTIDFTVFDRLYNSQSGHVLIDSEHLLEDSLNFIGQ